MKYLLVKKIIYHVTA